MINNKLTKQFKPNFLVLIWYNLGNGQIIEVPPVWILIYYCIIYLSCRVFKVFTENFFFEIYSVIHQNLYLNPQFENFWTMQGIPQNVHNITLTVISYNVKLHGTLYTYRGTLYGKI